MNTILIILVAILTLVHLYLSLALTCLIFKSSVDVLGKIAQIIFVWLIPLLGSIVIGYLRLEEYEIRRYRIPTIAIPLFTLLGVSSLARGDDNATSYGSEHMDSDADSDNWIDI